MLIPAYERTDERNVGDRTPKQRASTCEGDLPSPSHIFGLYDLSHLLEEASKLSSTMYSFLPYTFLATLFLLLKQSSACMHYSATFPYSNSHPFEATITDNGVVTCWISMTYEQHSKQQIAFANRQLGRPQALPPIKPGRIFLTACAGNEGADPTRSRPTGTTSAAGRRHSPAW